MSFFYADLKREVKQGRPSRGRPRQGHIPIESLNKMGCSVCPRDKDKTLLTPKMAPSGSRGPLIYLLGTGPNEEEDSNGIHWSGNAGRAITSKFTPGFFKRSIRSNHITQCMPAIGGPGHPDVVEIECCRGRVVPDIEESKPLVVVGVGDEPLHWATGLPRSALTFRGTLIATKIGKHVCWYYPVLYPNYIRGKQRRGKSEYELTLEHDLANIEDMVERGLEPPTVYDAPYDSGIELITGQEGGDLVRLEQIFHRLIAEGGDLGLDLETNGIKPYKLGEPKIWTAAVGTFDKTYAFSIDHPDGWGTETRQRRVKGAFGEFLLQSGRKRCHNVAFEQEWLAFEYGDSLLRLTEWEDTMAMAYVSDPRKGTKSLDTQCRVHLGFFLKDQSPVDVSQTDWINKFTIKQTLRYNALDAKWCYKLADVRLEEIKKDKRLNNLYENRMRLAPTLVLTTARGMPVDFEYANKVVEVINTKCDQVEVKLRSTPEVKAFTSRFGTFSITNDHHVLKLMKDVLRRPEIEQVDWSGKISTSCDEKTLLSMPTAEVPSAKLILDHRQLRRNETTYLGPLIEGKMTGPDGIIHAEYNGLHTATNRLSSEMHNWPKHKNREVRGAIAAGEGQWLLACDYGQIEFRVCGILSGDENITKYSWTGYDVHGYWASRMLDEHGSIKDWIVEEFNVDWDEKGLKTLRQVAKNEWVFPQLFGATAQSCANNCHLPMDVAEYLVKEFWDEFRGHKLWQERLLKNYAKYLYVETMGGWRRSGPMTLNEAINAPIQGTAAEIVLEAMNALSERSQIEDDVELHPAFNGHDDLTFVVSDKNLTSKISTISHEMCKPRFDYINVPLIVEVSVGERWHQLKEIAKYSSVDLFNLKNPYQ